MPTKTSVAQANGLTDLARKVTIGALCAAALTLATPMASTSALAAAGLQGQDALPPATAPDTSTELENSDTSEAAIGAVPQAVTRSACLLPFFKITYPISLTGKGVFRFVTTPKAPPKGFNVVMTLKYPGLSRTVNNFGPGKAEAFNIIKTFKAKVNGKVIVSGVGGSYGCFVLKVTP